MNNRLLWALPILLPTLAMACLPSARKFSDDDDDGGDDGSLSVGTSTGQSTSGAGGSTSGAGGAGSTTSNTVNGSGPTSTTSAPAATTTGGTNDICGSGLSTGSVEYDTCLTNSCCASFNACLNETECNGCLSNATTACESNTLLAAFDSCSSNACPTDMCDTGIGFSDGNGSPAFDCNECGTNSCCGSLNTCVQGGSDPEVSTCLDCMNGDPGCSSAPAAVQTAAEDFNACISSNCSLECG